MIKNQELLKELSDF